MRIDPRRLPATLLALATLALLLPDSLALAAPAPVRRAAPRAAGAASAGSSAAARQAIEAVVERYRTLTAYRLEGQATTEVGNRDQHQTSLTGVRFVVRKPDHIANEVRTEQMTTRMVADGESLWTAIPDLGQYQVQPLSALRANMEPGQFERQFDPAGEFTRLLDGVATVRALGPDTVRTARGVVTCQRYALALSDTVKRAPGVTVLPRVVWVEPATHLVWMDSVRIEQTHPQYGVVHTANLTRMVVAAAEPALPADAFRYRVEPNLRRVRRFLQSSPQHAAMEGQPATDFTLDPLGDGPPVRLADLKGKVVLLDFWATWCGPCRGWLPIVARARHEFEPKGLVVYAVNERETEDKVREYLAKQKLDVPVLLDLSGKVGGIYRADSIPLTVVVGRDGKVLRVMLGLHDEDDLREVLHEAGLD